MLADTIFDGSDPKKSRFLHHATVTETRTSRVIFLLVLQKRSSGGREHLQGETTAAATIMIL